MKPRIYKTLSIFTLLFLISNTYIVPESKNQEVRIKKLENELKTLRKEFNDYKRSANKSTKSEKTEKEEEKPNQTKSIAGDSTPTGEVKKYNIQSKGLRIQSLEDNEGKRYAITIGINNYKDTAISKLSKARNDAKIVGKILKESGQFDMVAVMTDDIDPRNDPENLYPSKLNIEEKLDSILRFANPEDLIVFFFSGHGISDPDENGYLVTVDTVTDKQFNTALRVQEVVDRLSNKRIKKSLLVLDACRDVLYASKSSSRNSILQQEFSEAEVAATFYSTKAGYYSYEDDETDYGVFTKYLVRGMEGFADRNEDGVVAFSELEQYVQKGVKDWSTKKNKQQKPFTRIHGEKTGDLAITFNPNKKKESLTDKHVPDPITRSDVVFRSATFPGWGQSYAGSKKKGMIYSGVTIGLLGYFVYNVNKMNSAQKTYSNAIVVPGNDGFYPTYFNLQNNRAELSKAGNSVSLSLALLGGFWLWNIIDSGVFTKLPKNEFFTMDAYPRISPNDRTAKVEQYGTFGFQMRF